MELKEDRRSSFINSFLLPSVNHDFPFGPSWCACEDDLWSFSFFLFLCLMKLLFVLFFYLCLVFVSNGRLFLFLWYGHNLLFSKLFASFKVVEIRLKWKCKIIANRSRIEPLISLHLDVRNTHSELRIHPRSGCIEIIKIWLHTNYLFNSSGMRKT